MGDADLRAIEVKLNQAQRGFGGRGFRGGTF